MVRQHATPAQTLREGLARPGPGDALLRCELPEHGLVRELILRGGRLVGFQVSAADPIAPRLKVWLGDDGPLPSDALQAIYAPPTDADGQLACRCRQVSCAQVGQAIEAGAGTVEQITRCTGAGSGCGSCADSLQAMLAERRGQSEAEAWYVPIIPMDKPALSEAIRERGLKTVPQVLDALATGDDVRSRMGIANLLQAIWGDDRPQEPWHRFINDRVRANIQADGTFSVVPRMHAGLTSPAELARIADVAERFGVAQVKLTGNQRVQLLGIQKQDLPAIWRELGMPAGGAYTHTLRGCKTCVGASWCRFGTADSIGIGQRIEERFGNLPLPHKVKAGVSACEHNCAEALTKDIGLVADAAGRWRVHVGGAAGSTVRRGDLLAVCANDQEVMRLIGRFLQYYQDHARWLERTYSFVPRLGIDHLRRVLTPGNTAEARQLEERIDRASAQRHDPWQGQAAPAELFTARRRISLPVLVA